MVVHRTVQERTYNTGIKAGRLELRRMDGWTDA